MIIIKLITMLLSISFLNRIFVLTISLFLIQSVSSQELKRVSINSLGGIQSNGTLALSQSVGQSSLVTKFKSDKVSINQGFQQPISSVLSGTDQTIEVQLFPNPNAGQFQFSVSLARNEAFDYFIYDQVGRIIAKGEAKGNLLESVDLTSKTSSGSYHLKIKTADGSVGNSKLIITK